MIETLSYSIDHEDRGLIAVFSEFFDSPSLGTVEVFNVGGNDLFGGRPWVAVVLPHNATLADAVYAAFGYDAVIYIRDRITLSVADVSEAEYAEALRNAVRFGRACFMRGETLVELDVRVL